MKKLPIGVSNFHKLLSNDYLFCDKTAMIADLLKSGDEVTLITRPRRWGKTLNMSMLQHFFASELNGITTAGLFDDLAIGKLEGGKYVREHQGKHPVIMISFKDVNAADFQGAYNAVYELILELYSFHLYLFTSDKINALQLEQLYVIRNRQANQQVLENALKLLSQCLYQHHGQKVYMLIDEYDTPLNKAYGNKAYLDAMVALMRNLFSAALKDNTALEKGILTGILRVSKDSMLSGLNNLETYTILDDAYSSHFGFREVEVESLFKAKDLGTSMEAVRNWYNGYKVGGLVMYNPWSIISCINRSGRFDVYWVNTGNNDLVKELLFRSGSGIKSKFERLMQGASFSVPIDKHLSFDLLGRDDNALWSLLLFAGYLKFETVAFNEYNGLHDCQLLIPNKEVHTLYNRFFREWLSNQFDEVDEYESFLDHLITGNVPCFTQALRCFLLQSVSCFDTHVARKSEGFYHGFVLAMLASLGRTHYIRSNRESGFGRYDLLLIPKQEGLKALLLEFKQVRKEEELENASKLALAQIEEQAYHTELLQYPHVKEVIGCGIAFSGKSVLTAYVTYDLVRKQSGDVSLTSKYSEQEVTP
ncbi:MAG: ATP-binding protein [Candidatus Cardinium sp.]|uniref:AAA family ATPase n=1 Tax=Cardinium endosymbiont of Dermatophagoides farinae TaxID=2597823 RepID=UPI001182B325|nr:AAA family ATPase [Cardinium endosymbiont of Dermatophagoides farinae]TSJ80540.1 AAA family ATPase [Cardinium endosymbiont of Dermatophagoides farinae]UWW96513.1 MAG: ATP-binding protein [Candidatus Cardinium sp.]